jgi:rod shape determining protein RodA
MHTATALRAAWRLLARMDKPMLGLTLLLVATGLLFVYGVGQEVGGEFAKQWQRQLANALVGFLVYLLCAAVDYRRLADWSWLGYLAAVVILALVLTPLGVVRNNSRSWLALPGVGVPLQPSELAKPAVVLFMAWLAAHPLARASRVHAVFPCLLALAAPLGLILLQPDFGTGLVYIPFTLAIAFAARLRWRWILGAGVLLLAAILVLYPRLKSYQRDRIKVFLDAPSSLAVAVVSPFLPSHLRENAEKWQTNTFRLASDTWNAQQSLLAVGSGGLWGKGFMNGTQHVLGFLPRNVASSDFIFSVIGEETGFIGAAGVVCALIGVLLCILRTAIGARDDLGCYIAVGVATLFFTHAFTNIGMTVKAAPIVGLPLPFVSHGGSFMLCTMACAGLVQSVHIRRSEAVPPSALG